MKICSRCHVEKSIDEFHVTVKYGKPYEHAACKECHRGAVRAHYEANKASYVTKAARAREDLQKEVRELKERYPCADCGVRYPHYVMDYDHRPGEAKVGVVSRLLFTHGRKVVMAEIAKCDLVCSNCHRVRTHLRTTRLA